MTDEEFYKDIYSDLKFAEKKLKNFCENEFENGNAGNDRNAIEHYRVRIKSAESMIAKLEKLGLPIEYQSVAEGTHDAVGARIVCPFLSGVREIAQKIRNCFDVVEEKDYIVGVKPNGYRSLHIIVRLPANENQKNAIYAEFQLRTIAMDCWASLEHQLKYKKQINNEKLIVDELKRCANELASADLTMQTIYDLINCKNCENCDGE